MKRKKAEKIPDEQEFAKLQAELQAEKKKDRKQQLRSQPKHCVQVLQNKVHHPKLHQHHPLPVFLQNQHREQFSETESDDDSITETTTESTEDFSSDDDAEAPKQSK